MSKGILVFSQFITAIFFIKVSPSLAREMSIL